MVDELEARCRSCDRLLPVTDFPLNRGRFRRPYCRACHRAMMRPYWVAYRAAHTERLQHQAYQRRRRTEYRPNRRLTSIVARARQQAQERETQVGYYALLRAIFAVPEEQAGSE